MLYAELRHCLTNSTYSQNVSVAPVFRVLCVVVYTLQVPSAELEEDVYRAAAYVAAHTMTVLEELFTEAR